MNISVILLSRITEIFRQHFGEPAFIVRSPGRINLIGEHTDYNLGFVLPASIDKAVYIAINKRDDKEINLVAVDLNETFHTALDTIQYTDKQWPNYILGIVDQLQKNGYGLSGFNAVLGGDVPLGAGLSSSAAVECATAYALNKLFALELTKKAMIQLSQKAENEFVGVQCGIMDQFASILGKKEQVIRLDCRSLEYVYIPFDISDSQIILFDTGVKHSLASSEYNLRRQQCEAGVAILQKKYQHVQSLRDADMLMVNTCLREEEDVVYRRCKYVVEEIQRVQNACVDLIQQDLTSFGRKMFATHEGLSRLYEVSCPEADALVTMVTNHPAVLGARMMGGGFGGCTINIVKKGKTEELINSVTQKYSRLFSRLLKAYIVSIDDGTSLV